MNEAISACMFLKLEGSYMRFSTVLGSTVLVLIIMNEAISACRFLKMKGSYMRVSTVLVAGFSPFHMFHLHSTFCVLIM